MTPYISTTKKSIFRNFWKPWNEFFKILYQAWVLLRGRSVQSGFLFPSLKNTSSAIPFSLTISFKIWIPLIQPSIQQKGPIFEHGVEFYSGGKYNFRWYLTMTVMAWLRDNGNGFNKYTLSNLRAGWSRLR